MELQQLISPLSLESIDPITTEEDPNNANDSDFENSRDSEWTTKEIFASNITELTQLLTTLLARIDNKDPASVQIKGYNVQKVEREGSDSSFKILVEIKRPITHATLEDLIEKHKRESSKGLSEEKTIKYFYSLVSKLENLHKNHIVHGNVKPANILVNAEGRIKLVGAHVGIDIKDEIPYKEDVWDLGMVMAELCLLGKGKIDSSHTDQSMSEMNDIIQEKCRKELADIVNNMLSMDLEERKSLTEIKGILKQKFGNIIEGKQKRSEHKENEEEKVESIGRGAKKPLTEIMEIKESRPSVSGGVRPGSILYSFNEDKENIASRINRSQTEVPRSFKLEKSSWQKRIARLQNQWKIFQINSDEKGHLEISSGQSEKITDSQLQSLIEELVYRPKNEEPLHLITLALDLEWCAHITDDALKYTAKIIENNSATLQNLSLNYFRCGTITDHGVENLMTVIGELQNLQQLTLHFGDSSKSSFLTNEGINSVAKNVNRLTSLQSLTLEFSKCDFVTDDSIQYLGYKIKEGLRQLQQVHIGFFNCKEISEKALSKLQKELSFVSDIVIDH